MKLNSPNFKYDYANLIVSEMNSNELKQFVIDTLCEKMDSMNMGEIKEEIKEEHGLEKLNKLIKDNHENFEVEGEGV